jgi:hypothetical protein
MTVPLALIINAVKTEAGLRVDKIHEWPNETLANATTLLVEKCGWPSSVSFEPTTFFGASS